MVKIGWGGETDFSTRTAKKDLSCFCLHFLSRPLNIVTVTECLALIFPFQNSKQHDHPLRQASVGFSSVICYLNATKTRIFILQVLVIICLQVLCSCVRVKVLTIMLKCSCNVNPLKPHIYNKIGVYRDIHYCLIFALIHRLWILV